MKRSRAIILTAICLNGYFSGFGQAYDDFDLSTYVTPDIVRNELDFSLKSSGSFDDKETSDNDNYGINGNFGSVFNRYKNTRSFWSTQRAEAGLSGNSNNQQGIKHNSYGFLLNYTNKSRFYRQNKSFFEIGGTVKGELNGLKYTNNESVTTKTHSSVIYSELPLHVGKGRIEQVEDARQAIYILENLSKRGVLKRKLTDAEIHTFAKTISTIKNARFFDSRLHLIDEISTVDSFFVKNDFLESSGASYFTTLYDYWMYGDLFKRGSGTVLSAGVTPSIMYDDDKTTDATEHLSTKLKGDISITYEKPVNLYWQRSAYAEAYGMYGHDRLEYGVVVKYDTYNAGLKGNYAWSYYPNSRTNLSAGVEENCGWVKRSMKTKIQSEVKTNLISGTGAFLDLYYYFSPQLRLSAYANLGFNYNRQLNSKAIDKNDFRWNGNFMATLTYSLF